MTRKQNILKIILIIAITFLTLFVTCKSVDAVPNLSTYNTGEVTTINDLYNTAAVYCFNHSWDFQPGQYLAVEFGSFDKEMAFMIYEGIKEATDKGIPHNKLDETSVGYLVKLAVWKKMGFEPKTNPEDVLKTELLKQKYEDLWQKEKVIESLNSFDDATAINKPAEGEFLQPTIDQTTGKEVYGPFNITYPGYQSKATQKYEFAGDELKILVNGKELSYLPESGQDFYLTEDDGIVLGEENSIKITYKATTIPNGTWTRYTPYRNDLMIYLECPGCNGSFWTTGSGFYDSLNNMLYSNDIGNNIQGAHEADCIYVDKRVQLTVSRDTQNPERLFQDVLLAAFYGGDVINEEHEVKFWAGRKLVIDLNKTDNAKLANALKNIEFEVSISGDDKAFIKQDDGQKPTSTKITTDANGSAQITIIACGETITVTFTETDDKFYINNGPIVIDFTYNQASKTWTPTIRNSAQLRDVVSIVQQGDWFEFKLNIINIAKIEDLILTKLNKLIPGEKLPGIEFQIVLKNATDMNNNSNLRVVTDANGNIELGTLKVLDPNEDIVITITETGVPTTTNVNYKGLYGGGTATITIRHATNGCQVRVIGADRDVVEAEYDLEKNMVILQIYNEITIDLSGEVWLDGQTGIKPVQAPNNKKDAGEQRLENIKVVAKRVSDNAIIDTKYTDKNGIYEFKDLPASLTGNVQYVIEFTYDGINYIAVTPHVGAANEDSDGQEIDRAAFNARFATIVKDKAIGTDGTVTNLTYSYDATSAKLQTMNGTEVKPEFAMVATTEPTRYNENTKDIDLGLVKKAVDLATLTDLYSATVSINGESKRYNYNDLSKLDGSLIVSGDVQPSYNLYLYNSDYNYRIGDYKGLGTSKLYEGMNPAQNGDMAKTIANELDIELTYQILLNNQSATTATVNSIAYYYDARLELVTPITDAVLEGTVTIDDVTYNKLLIPINQIFTDTANQGVTSIAFKVGKDSTGSLKLGDIKNWIEIISYSTDAGCIDIDSAPDNIEVHKTEDDTDDARGVNIQINIADRTISGYVFEDQKDGDHGNGTYDTGEQVIDDVIVQLIEIKEVTVGGVTNNLEYIWQETTTGSDVVKYITTDGKNIGTYNVAKQNGTYTFRGFIPGNYVVRFIYGDGTYWDSAINTNNILKYNGQDYKSTIDSSYNKKWYDSAAYVANSSMARDNEARRLEEMNYAMQPGRSLSDLLIDSKEKLANTWMCAETSLVKIPISDTDDTSLVVTRGINFGLETRARSELMLEKHVTYVKIEGVTEATADIYDYTDDKGMMKFRNIQGKAFNPLSTPTIKEKDERGSWILETQIDKIRGKVQINYTYRILNNGEHEYLGRDLVQAVADGTTYEQVYNLVKENMKQSKHVIGTYIGTNYYTGETGLNDIEVGARFKVEDYLNNTKNIGGAFTTVEENKTFPILESVGNPKTQTVNVLQTDIIELGAGQENTSTILNTERDIDTASTKKEFTYRSYATQLVPVDGIVTSRTGTLDKASLLGNLKYIQGNTRDIKLSDLINYSENDEYIAESVVITVETGADQKSPVLLIASITGGLVLIAVGIILIKKFVIK